MLGSATSADPRTRAVVSSGYAIGLLSYFVRMNLAVAKAAMLKELSASVYKLIEISMAILSVAFVIGAALEVKVAISGQQL